jgi:hypothetical protein
MVRVRGVDFDVLPWTESDHGKDCTWWFRVRVAIENLPVHAWNAQVAGTVLGDDCIFDQIETVTPRQESTDIFFCWVWMADPDYLHRTKRVTIFPPVSGQSPEGGHLRQNREVAPPPRGTSFDLIVHLDRIEDWTPPRVRTPLSPQSGRLSSDSSDSVEYPKIYCFEDWEPGVVDGRTPLPRAACHPPVAYAPWRHDREDDEDNGPGRRHRCILDKDRVAFNMLRCSAGQGSSGGGARERTRSPVPHRRRVTAALT